LARERLYQVFHQDILLFILKILSILSKRSVQ
jgi:hypothetical protein